MAELSKVEVGFIGNQVITLRLDSDELADLRKRLSEGGWASVKTDDGEVDVDLGKVAFVRIAGGDHSVGFGS